MPAGKSIGKPLVGLIFGALLLGVAGQPSLCGAQEKEHTLSPHPMERLGPMEKYFLGQYQVGTFPGRLVCLRCDTMPTPENIEVCKKEGHRHALAMEGDTMVHPLIFTSEELFKQVSAHDWYRKKVKVWGQYYADTGNIVVGNIEVVEE